MNKFSFLVLMSITSLISIQSNGNPLTVKDFTNRIVLVEQFSPTKNSFFDVFQVANDGKTALSAAPQMTSFNWFGACLPLQGALCSKDFSSKDMYARAFAQSSGHKDAPLGGIPSMQDLPVTTVTTAKVEGNYLLLDVSQKIMSSAQPAVHFKVSLVSKLSDKAIGLQTPEKDEPNRTSLEEQTDNVKALSNSVVQIILKSSDESNLIGASSGSGTGFFIDDGGYLLTNHHVSEAMEGCLTFLKCPVEIRITQPDGTINNIIVPGQILADSPVFDFTLIRVAIPTELKFKALKLGSSKIGPNVLTLGYPGDKSRNTQSGSENIITFSRGVLVGFESRTFATSAYVYGGASGSPLLDPDDFSVMGIISNGSGTATPGIGSPGLARPIDYIEAEFGLSEYLSGKKALRVSEIAKDLMNVRDEGQANTVILKYLSERTFLGLPKIKAAMLANPNLSIRNAIMRKLEEAGLIRGVSEDSTPIQIKGKS